MVVAPWKHARVRIQPQEIPLLWNTTTGYTIPRSVFIMDLSCYPTVTFPSLLFIVYKVHPTLKDVFCWYLNDSMSIDIDIGKLICASCWILLRMFNHVESFVIHHKERRLFFGFSLRINRWNCCGCWTSIRAPTRMLEILLMPMHTDRHREDDDDGTHRMVRWRLVQAINRALAMA